MAGEFAVPRPSRQLSQGDSAHGKQRDGKQQPMAKRSRRLHVLGSVVDDIHAENNNRHKKKLHPTSMTNDRCANDVHLGSIFMVKGSEKNTVTNSPTNAM
jgi:hypothetical protein